MPERTTIQNTPDISGAPGFRFTASTHAGKVREINEDSIISLPEIGLWSVSDGMGGHAAGDFASQTVVEALSTLPLNLPPAELMGAAREVLQKAHRLIRQHSDNVTVGATVVTLIIANGHFVSLWAGDSRLYRRRDGVTEMLTTDHSLVADLVLAGEMSWDEAEDHPHSNAITRAVGVGEELEIDKIRGDVHPGDRFLLCSDGLTKYLGIDELGAILARAPIETVSDTLINIALERGGADNVSVIVIDAD